MEYEGRMFGNLEELVNDALRYQERMCTDKILEVLKPHILMDFGTHKVKWVLITSLHDVHMKTAGMQFSQIMFDQSFPHDCLSYCLSRLRAPGRGR